MKGAHIEKVIKQRVRMGHSPECPFPENMTTKNRVAAMKRLIRRGVVSQEEVRSW